MIEQSYDNIIKTRCIQVVDDQAESYVDYHTLIESVEQEELNGEYLVDHIIKNAYPPLETWIV